MRTKKLRQLSRIGCATLTAFLFAACDKESNFVVEEESIVEESSQSDGDALAKKIDVSETGEGDALAKKPGGESGAADAFDSASSEEDARIKELLDRLIPDGNSTPIQVKEGDESSEESRILESLGPKVVTEIADGTASSEFESDALKDGSISFGLNEYNPTQEMVLKNSTQGVTRNFTQITRPSLLDIHQQGFSGNSNTETFAQNESMKLLDILVVVDNSGSMEEEQNGLATRLNPLLSYVSDADWRIGVTTTDPVDPCIHAIINKGDANPTAAFASAVTVGIDGSGNEQGIRRAVDGLKGQCLSSQWLRDNSTVAILIVSDEDNCSENGSQCEGEAWQNTSYLTDHLSGIRTVGYNARVYGLVWHPDQTRNECATAYNIGTQYGGLIDATGGAWGSICPNGAGNYDYSAPLAAISQNISTILENQFVLSQTPSNGQVTVKVNGTVMSEDYQLTGKNITFSTPPAEGSSIEVSYKYGATPIKSKFALSEPAVSGSITATINNAAVSNFSFNEATNEVVFATAPAENSELKFNFMKNTALPNTFDVGSSGSAMNMKAKINGTATTAFQYNATTGIVSFAQAPIDAASIVVTYDIKGDPILSYAYQRVSAQSDFTLIDAETMEPVGHTLEEAAIKISPEEFAEGRMVLAKEDNTGIVAQETMALTLPQTPITESVELMLAGESCSGEALTVTSSNVDWSTCGLSPAPSDEGSVMYSYYDAEALKFAMDAAFFATPHVLQVWTVHVDGELRTDYLIEANSVVFSEGLANGSKVKIDVKLIKSL